MELLQKSWFDESTPYNAKKASGVLTISGVVIDGQTITIGSEVYEVAGDVLQTVTTGRIPVNITSYGVAAQGTLTIDTQPTATNTMTIAGVVYTFRAPADTDADGEISIGTDLASAKIAIVAAINGTDGINTANPHVSAATFVGDACVLTAKVVGVLGNTRNSVETFTAGTNVFDAVTLGTTRAGVDCIASNAVLAIVASITTNSTLVTAADTAGDTVTVTSKVVGTEPNDYATTETMTNGAWGAVKLAGGLYCTLVSQPSYIIIGGVYYIATKGSCPTTTDCWYAATPALIT